jgi:hypothetical protein
MVGRAEGDGPFERTARPGRLHGSGPFLSAHQLLAPCAGLKNEVHVDLDVFVHL